MKDKFPDFPTGITKLTGDRIAIRPFHVMSNEEERGVDLHLPNGKIREMAFTFSRNPWAGEVVLVGDGVVSDHEVNMRGITVGSVVIVERGVAFDYSAGNLLTVPDGESYFIIRRSNIMAVFEMPATALFEDKEKWYNQINKQQNEKEPTSPTVN